MFDFNSFFHADIKPATGRWTGFPSYNFIGGHNDETMVPVKALRASAEKVMREHAEAGWQPMGSGMGLLAYTACGNLSQMRWKHAPACQPTRITSCWYPARFRRWILVNETLLREGDIVIMEESTYGGVISRFQHLKVQIIGIRVNEDGMDLDVLETELETLKAAGKAPRYIYTIPTIHNPTGTIMPIERRQQLLALATRYEVPIFEDDCYADLIFDDQRPPTIRSLDDSGRVIYCGSFSKTIAPALRVGYLDCGLAFFITGSKL